MSSNCKQLIIWFSNLVSTATHTLIRSLRGSGHLQGRLGWLFFFIVSKYEYFKSGSGQNPLILPKFKRLSSVRYRLIAHLHFSFFFQFNKDWSERIHSQCVLTLICRTKNMTVLFVCNFEMPNLFINFYCLPQSYN